MPGAGGGSPLAVARRGRRRGHCHRARRPRPARRRRRPRPARRRRRPRDERRDPRHESGRSLCPGARRGVAADGGRTGSAPWERSWSQSSSPNSRARDRRRGGRPPPSSSSRGAPTACCCRLSSASGHCWWCTPDVGQSSNATMRCVTVSPFGNSPARRTFGGAVAVERRDGEKTETARRRRQRETAALARRDDFALDRFGLLGLALCLLLLFFLALDFLQAEGLLALLLL